ncbi:MAG: iron-sulfur cluster assembly accessory protein [Chlamydiales bacterium]|nr:iron-sulfur cluster assembly accessory protein [Chlamydiales bacterium]
MITKEMKIESIILDFPQKGQKLRRAMRGFLSCSGDLPNEKLEDLMMQKGKTSVDVDFLVGKLNEILEEKIDTTCISITEKAARQLKEHLIAEGKGNWGIKIADRPALCGTGFQYIFEPAPSPASEDQIFLSNGVEIYTPRGDVNRFLGSLVDYLEEPIDDDHFTGLLSIGFTISNPNVQTTCACGCSNLYREFASL